MRTEAWPLEADEIQSVFQTLRFAHCKWDIYHRGRDDLLPDSIILSQAEHRELVESARATWLALRELEAAVLNRPDILAAIGVPKALRPLLAGPRPAAPRLTRCDFHLAVGGRWIMTEFNEDGPGGYTESFGLKAVLEGGFGERFPGRVFAGDIRQAIIDAFAPWQQIGMVLATAYSADLQQIALIADWLRAAGKQVTIGSPANLVMQHGQASLFEQPVEALFRYYPGEWIGDLPNLGDWAEACQNLPMVNDLAALAAQSKRFYAVGHTHDIGLSPPSQSAIERHLPRSAYLEAALREQLIAERGDWVLKGAFGRMGDTVRLGIGSSPEQWTEAIDRALLSAEPYAVQQRFDPVPLWFSNGLAYATIGLYLLDGQFAGYYSRVSPYPVINDESQHVATLVEAA
jgi:glutathionylspermidine synthase